MAERGKNTVVGLFALTGVVVMCVLVFLFGGGRSLFANTYDVRVHFPRGVIGVQEGQGVTLNGKRIGDTKSVEFHDPRVLDSGVDVVVAVDGQYNIPKDSAVFVAASIMGFGKPAIRMVVKENPSTERLARDGRATIPGAMVPILDQMLPPEMQSMLTTSAARLGELAASMTPVTAELNRLLEARTISDVDAQRVSANLDIVVQRLDGTLRNFNLIVGDQQNQENLRLMLANGRKMSETGVALAEDLRGATQDGRNLFTQGSRLMQNLTNTSDQLTAMLRSMDQTLALVNEGKGTAGLLLKDNRLYEELVLSARRLTKALDDARDVLEMAKKGELRIKAF